MTILQKYPLVFTSVFVYLGFVLISFASIVVTGEYLLFMWPHLAGLALQEFNLDSDLGVFILQLLGLVWVALIAATIQWKLGSNRPAPTVAWKAGVILVLIALLTFTAGSFALAGLMGWPYGV